MGKRLILAGAAAVWLLDQIAGRVQFGREMRQLEHDLWRLLDRGCARP